MMVTDDWCKTFVWLDGFSYANPGNQSLGPHPFFSAAVSSDFKVLLKYCITIIITLTLPGRSAESCDKHVYMSVCLSAHSSQKPHVQTSQNFLYALTVPVTVTSDVSASCLLIISEAHGQSLMPTIALLLIEISC